MEEWAANPPTEEDPMDEGCLKYARYKSAVICQCDHVVIMHTWYRPDVAAIASAGLELCPWCYAKGVAPDKAEEIDKQDHGHTEFLGGPAVCVRTGMTSAEYEQFQLFEMEMSDGEAG